MNSVLMRVAVGLMLLALGAGGIWYYLTRLPDGALRANVPTRVAPLPDGVLQYLNEYRQQAGVGVLAPALLLQQSAENHAKYLLRHRGEGHVELQRNSPLFTGQTVKDRTVRVGYGYQGVQENLFYGNNIISASESLSLLMTAIYHRFSLLSQDTNEAGSAWLEDGDYGVLVINQGNTNLNALCRQTRFVQSGRVFLKNSCHQQRALIYQDELPKPMRDQVVFPVGQFVEPNFADEVPDPLPDRAYSGNPISVEFAPNQAPVEMLSFELYRGNNKIQETRILSAKNDHHHQFNARQFALFPLKLLDYDTEYRAVFQYRQNGKPKKIEWTYRTRQPHNPYFVVKGGEVLAVKQHQKYDLIWQPVCYQKSCRERHINYSLSAKHQLRILRHGANDLTFQASGSRLGKVKIYLPNGSGKAVQLHFVD